MRRRTLDPAEATFFADLQRMLSRSSEAIPDPLSRIGGVDAAYYGDYIFAAARVFENGQLVDEASYAGRCSLPYVSGLFYLREGPFVVAAARLLRVRPQLLCFDAHGAAHPRSAGLATMCGMLLGIPSVGIAKSVLVGEVSRAAGLDRIVHDGKTVGFVTTTEGSKRYWSPGYSVTLASLRSMIMTHASECLEALREAHRAANQERSSFFTTGGAARSHRLVRATG